MGPGYPAQLTSPYYEVLPDHYPRYQMRSFSYSRVPPVYSVVGPPGHTYYHQQSVQPYRPGYAVPKPTQAYPLPAFAAATPPVFPPDYPYLPGQSRYVYMSPYPNQLIVLPRKRDPATLFDRIPYPSFPIQAYRQED